MRESEVVQHIIDDIVVGSQVLTQKIDQLNAALLNIKAALEAGRRVLIDPIAGPGKWFFNASLLNDAQMAEMEAAVHDHHFVIAILDFANGKYHMARVISMVGETVVVVPWGVDELKPNSRRVLPNPRKDIWGWYIAPLVDGV